MQKRFLNLSLILASLIGYLEWGRGQSVFLFEAETQLFLKGLSDPMSVLHPFTLIPVLGQAALVVTLFQKNPGRGLTYAGVAGVGLLFAFMSLIGLLSLNPKILASTVPFLVLAVVTVRVHRRSPADGTRTTLK